MYLILQIIIKKQYIIKQKMHSGSVLYKKDANSEDGSISPGLSQDGEDGEEDDYLQGYDNSQLFNQQQLLQEQQEQQLYYQQVQEEAGETYSNHNENVNNPTNPVIDLFIENSSHQVDETNIHLNEQQSKPKIAAKGKMRGKVPKQSVSQSDLHKQLFFLGTNSGNAGAAGGGRN